MNYHYYRQFYKKALYPSSWRVIGAKLSKYALIYVCITVFLVASVSAEDSQELSSSQTYEQITVVAKNELIQKPITDLEHKAVEGKKDVSTSSWTKVIVEGAEASLVHPSEFADQPKTLVFEKDNKAFVSNPDNPVAKVTFTPHAKVVDERENPISFSEFSPPTRLQPAEELYVDEHLPHVQVHSVYHVGDFDPLFVQGKTATKAMATVQLPFPENVLGGEVKVYSSQDGYTWKYHGQARQSTIKEESVVLFETDHFTFFLLATELGTFVVNNDDLYTTTQNVTLQSAISGAVQMKIANSYQDLATATWQPYAASTGWSLASGNSIKTVHAIFEDANGITGYVSDVIILKAPFTPVLPNAIAGLSAWYDASVVSSFTKNGAQRVSERRDISGNNRHLSPPTQPRRPVYDPAGLGGIGSIRFDGTDQTLYGNYSFPKPYTILTVSQPDTTDTTGCLICGRDGFFILGYYFNFQSAMYVAGGPGWVFLDTAITLTNTIQIHTGKGSTSGTSYYAGGTLMGSDTQNRDALQRLQLGGVLALNSTSYHKRGQIGEVVIYDREITEKEREDVECYFADKRNTTVSHACDKSVAPALSNPSAITSPTTLITKKFSFDSTKAGIISLTGSCAGSLLTPLAVTGTNTITFGPLPSATYDDCGVYITDNLLQTSNTLLINTFVVDTGLTGTVTLPTALTGLQLWLDAADTATLTINAGNRIAQWNDKSGNGNDVQASNVGTDRRPLLLNADQNGLDTIQFTTDDSMVTTATSLIGDNTDYTKFMVMKLDNTAATNCTFGNFGGHTLFFGNSDIPRMWNQGNVLASSAGIGTSNYALITMTYDPSVQNNFSLNGAITASNNTVRSFNDAGVTYVGSWGNTCFLEGRIAELGVYNRGLSDDDREDLECYLAQKWGIQLAHSCLGLDNPPVLSNPGSIPSPLVSTTTTFTFDSDSLGTIDLYGSCEGTLQSSNNASIGSNTITLGPLYNGFYHDCLVTVTNSLGEVSNLLPLPAFDVTGGLTAPLVWSGVPNSSVMSSDNAGFSIQANMSGLLVLNGSCATSAISPETAITGLNTSAFAYLATGIYNDCSVSLQTLSGTSIPFVLPSFRIVEGPDFTLTAQPSFFFTGMVENQQQYLTKQATIPFAIYDRYGLNEGWYTTIQSTYLSGSFATIPATHIAMQATGVVLLSGDVNTSVVLGTGMTNFQSLDQPRLFTTRPSGPNQAKAGTYGVYPSVRLDIPAYQTKDDYHAVMTLTIYEE